MLFKKLITYLKAYRYWIAASAATGLAAGLLAAFFFNPYVVTYRIKNIGGYFTIETLKSAKLEAASLSRAALSKISDPARARTLSKMVGRPEWLEKNITPIFSITKADVRDLLDSQTDKKNPGDNRISFINLQDNSEDIQSTQANLNWLSMYILNLTQRNRLSQWVSATKTSSQRTLADIEQQLPNISLLISTNSERIEAIKKIIAENPTTLKNTQLNLSLNPGQGNNNNNNNNNNNPRLPSNNEDLTTFLAPESQLSGLEINQSYLQTTVSQLRFRQDLNQYLADRASEAQAVIDQLDLSSPQTPIDLPVNYWRDGKIADILKTEKGWRLDYAEGVLRGLEIQQVMLRSEYEEVARQSERVDYRRKFSRALAIAAGLLVGLMAPLLLFALTQMGEAETKPAESGANNV